MPTSLPPAAYYDHPQHGTYRSADELLADDRLSETQKQMAIEAWLSQLERGISEEADPAALEAAVKSLKGAADRLASGRH
ncbi:hypothetical protein [Jiella avicenniae]|uniref:Uncharacterized protein n=1 Tax=Jiella avicenniae TaxID=2907202 RepID=A0A9X1P2F0_9HYPH|nr:hypothetical protein [Jiella avicenniae]MCE7028519.1 hypothetical protein [Jiella avicenniae]